MTVDQIFPLEFKTPPALKEKFSRPLLNSSRLNPSDELERIVDPVVLDVRSRLFEVLSRTNSVSVQEAIESNRFFINRETFVETDPGDFGFFSIFLENELRNGPLRDFDKPFIITRVDTPVDSEELDDFRKSICTALRIWFQLIQSPDNYSIMIFGDIELWTEKTV